MLSSTPACTTRRAAPCARQLGRPGACPAAPPPARSTPPASRWRKPDAPMLPLMLPCLHSIPYLNTTDRSQCRCPHVCSNSCHEAQMTASSTLTKPCYHISLLVHAAAELVIASMRLSTCRRRGLPHLEGVSQVRCPPPGAGRPRRRGTVGTCAPAGGPPPRSRHRASPLLGSPPRRSSAGAAPPCIRAHHTAGSHSCTFVLPIA